MESIIVASGPSAIKYDKRVLAKVFDFELDIRINDFLWSEMHGSSFDAWWFAAPSREGQRIWSQARATGWDYGVLLTPAPTWDLGLLSYSNEIKNPWPKLWDAGFYQFGRGNAGLLPTSGIQASIYAAALGATEIVVLGLDLYSTGVLYASDYEANGPRFGKREGYRNPKHSRTHDLTSISKLLQVWPDCTIWTSLELDHLDKTKFNSRKLGVDLTRLKSLEEL
jgi:hypothetical protein